MNQCFINGSFPDSLKVFRAIPLRKKYEPEIIHNFRPISIINIFSKIKENLVKIGRTTSNLRTIA